LHPQQNILTNSLQLCLSVIFLLKLPSGCKETTGMIIHLKAGVDIQKLNPIINELFAVHLRTDQGDLLITPSSIRELPSSLIRYAAEYQVFDSDIQLASSEFKEPAVVNIGPGSIGRNLQNTAVIIGPCSVESKEQIEQSALLIKELGLSILRAGSFKPRTSPYSFQGLAAEGLKLLDGIRSKYGISIITEARDATHVDEVIEFTDIIQVGTKAMYDQGILRKCSKASKPVLIKRGFGSTLQDFVQAAEFILSGGNDQVILCERGIRTFETRTRFTLDLCGVSWLKEYTNLPVVLDPSHAIGAAFGVPDLARACMAMGVEGLLIEVHPDPSNAKSDAAQQLNHQQFRELFASLQGLAKALNRKTF
jgi:3-deoxy-7-phosphoheptulonate synthase